MQIKLFLDTRIFNNFPRFCCHVIQLNTLPSDSWVSFIQFDGSKILMITFEWASEVRLVIFASFLYQKRKQFRLEGAFAITNAEWGFLWYSRWSLLIRTFWEVKQGRDRPSSLFHQQWKQWGLAVSICASIGQRNPFTKREIIERPAVKITAKRGWESVQKAKFNLSHKTKSFWSWRAEPRE